MAAPAVLPAPPALCGRTTEYAVLGELLESLRAGRSAALVLRGEAGIGKTALLQHTVTRAEDCRVIRAAGVESEMELAFAALHQLCLPLLDGLAHLPAPQRDMLGTAFGLSAARRPERFPVALAVLSLLSDAAETRPLVCLIDDAQWLDRSSAQVLSFVARRLDAESVGMVFAERDGDPRDELAGLPQHRLQPLSTTEARELLASTQIGPVDERILTRIVAEARGNPLALLELPRGAVAPDLSSGFAPPHRIEASYRQRVRQLAPETQRLMLVAAAEPLGDPSLLWRAAAELAIPVEALAPAEAEDLVRVGARIVFRHPLLRSAIYGTAAPDERRSVHRALAAATDSAADPDRHAWHRAQATIAHDEDVAAELELSAGRAQARGGVAAAAAFLERAAELTPYPSRRGQRRLAAARAKRLAGLPRAASTLLEDAAHEPLSELDRAGLQRLRGQIALDLSRDSDAAPLLLDAARRFEPLSPVLARDTHLESLWAATLAGHLGNGVVAAATAARAAPRALTAPRATDLLVDGLAIRFTDGYAAGARVLRDVLSRFGAATGCVEDDALASLLASRIAAELFDDGAWNQLVTRDIQGARDAGALSVLPSSLNFLANLRMHECDLTAAGRLLDEADAITAATGNAPIVHGRLLLAAYRGDAREVELLGGQDRRRLALERGEGLVLTVVEWSRAILHNGLGHYEAALDAAQRANVDEHALTLSWSLPELVEAAARSDRSELALDAVERLSQRTRAAGTSLARGIEARARALVAEDTSAEELHVQAIELLGRTRMRLQRARAQLLYGEWLRRENRRVDARAQLWPAYETLAQGGATAFAERARRELLATGESARRRTDDTRDELTAQEEQIARLAAGGLTNPEIGAQLFLSPRTVEWHLRKVFTKLGIRSRKELAAA